MSDTIKYKDTSVGKIPVDWKMKKIKEIFDFFSTATYSRADMDEEGEIMYLHYGDIHTKFDFHLDLDKKQLPTISREKSKRYELLKDGDIIMVDASEDYDGVGKSIEIVNVNDKKIIAGLHTFLLRDKQQQLAPYYKGYATLNRQVTKQFQKLATGTKVYSLSKAVVGSIDIPIPSFPEQQKIAEILSTWDKAIQETNNIIKVLEKRNKMLAFSLLTGKTIKENIKELTLSQFLTFTSREIDKPEHNYLALGIRSHGKGIFHKPNFDPNTISMEKLYEVKENDFIVNITFAWEQAVAIISKEDEGGLVSHRFPTYVINENIISVEYFRHLILQPFFKYMLDNISPGGAGRNRVLSKKDLLKLKVKVPTLQEQNKIAEILNNANEELKQYKLKLENVKQQKKGLMQQLLTGRIRVITKN